MNHDQIALYLNDHPEFFNQYPELLARIKSIREEDIPLKPAKTVNLADRILKRAHDDKEQLRNQLEWFLELTQANEKIQAHLFEIERIILYSLDFSQMIRQLRAEIIERFNIPGVKIILIDNEDHLMEQRLRDRLTETPPEGLEFRDADTVNGWFDNLRRPTLQSDIEEGSELFQDHEGPAILSKALIPILLHGNLIGVLALGSENPKHFHEGLRTDFLERMADKLGIAIENVLLLDLMKNQPVMDAKTGLYNETYLDPVLRREFGWARCCGKPLSLLKLRIDSYRELVNTYGKKRVSQVRRETGKILAANSRGSDIKISSGEGEFLVLLPDTSADTAGAAVRSLQTALDRHLFPGLEPGALRFACGAATFTGDNMELPADLLTAASVTLDPAPPNEDKGKAIAV
ncbi:MAG: DUF484 family protein, partial [candidate division Zixibacteria bacterium]|nr:DUF484 family protein [candidate division Zixibacteria bacterium]NIW42596.1 DUF484 family protein [candidate division Zixibacteria bacterium]NIX58772.1 DUF484 family protein [candidate division Zixibacteria bacterium]